MIEVLASVLVFTGLVVGLSLVTVLLRAWLVPVGEVPVRVNEQRSFQGTIGERLLLALLDHGVLLPAACGGAGTCGLCRVRMERGGGPPTALETGRLPATALRAGERLACQVVLREPTAVWVPDEVLGVSALRCTVRSTRSVATLMKEIVLELPANAELAFRAGSFVQVTCPPYEKSFRELQIPEPFRAEWDRLDLWRFTAKTHVPVTRAYSLANAPAEQGIVSLVVRIAIPPPGSPPAVPPGVVSSFLFGLRPGDVVDVTGPYGHFFAETSEREMVFVGGGAGMAPMRSHILDQLLGKRTRRKITFWYGARNLQELFYTELFDRLQQEHDNFRWSVALSEPRAEDQWQGATGYIHEHLQKSYLASHPSPESCEYYLCGPPLMIRAVTGMLAGFGVPKQQVHFDVFG